jgi:predicted metal-dependent HD superfamily phosphohydrolase
MAIDESNSRSMNYSSILSEAENYIRTAEGGKVANDLPYHNIRYTEHVVARVIEIANYYKLIDEDYFVVVLSAWFKGYGYYSSRVADPEGQSQKAAAAFLRDRQVSEKTIDAVSHCIQATRLPQSPENAREEILCDADLFYLGTDKFSEINKLIRKETEHRLGEKTDKSGWRQKTIVLMESHHFHTRYARDLFQAKKQENLDKLKKKALKEKEEPLMPAVLQTGQAAKLEKPENQEAGDPAKKQKTDRPGKGIDTMFRISSDNHQRLSDMADNKANIMISTNSIIISVLLSTLLRKLEDNGHLVVPTILLLAICVTTMVFAILSTSPYLPELSRQKT